MHSNTSKPTGKLNHELVLNQTLMAQQLLPRHHRMAHATAYVSQRHFQASRASECQGLKQGKGQGSGLSRHMFIRVHYTCSLSMRAGILSLVCVFTSWRVRLWGVAASADERVAVSDAESRHEGKLGLAMGFF